MPKVKIREFRGIRDLKAVAGDPRYAITAEGVIINRGDICNMPPVIESFDLANPGISNTIGIIYKYKDKTYIITAGEDKFKRWELPLQGPLNIADLDIFELFGFEWPLINIESGNMVQVGAWNIYANLTASLLVQSDLIPRMLRMRNIKFDNNDPLVFHLLGLRAPFKVVHFPVDLPPGGQANFSGDVAITFRDYTVTNNVLDEAVFVESRATQANTNLTYEGSMFGLQFWLPLGHDLITPGGPQFAIGLYIRLDGSNHYLFAAELPLGYFINQGPDPDNQNAVKYILQPGISVTLELSPELLDQSQIAPITLSEDIIVRGVPHPSYHIEFFKNRVYYANIRDPHNRWPHVIEYTDLVGSEGLEANYVTNSFILGEDNKENTGLVQFLNQLVIFQEDKTYVLTGDPESNGEVILLFNDHGCVNKEGGHAYLVVDNVLYFLDRDGLYSWNGASPPRLISEDIRTKLEAIDRDKYNLARLSVNPRYGLLYLSFPRTGISLRPFIYHYRELDETGLGTWTIGKLNEYIFLNTNNEIYSLQHGKLARIGNLEELTLGSFVPIWHSNHIDLDNATKRKHFRTLSIENEDFDSTITVFIRDSGDVLKILEFNNNNEVLRVNSFSKNPTISLFPTSSKPFRIRGLLADIHLKGRR